MKTLTSSQVEEARQALTDQIQTVTGCTDDELLDLLEKLYLLARADAITDVIADLKSDGETDAVDLIEANYA